MDREKQNSVPPGKLQSKNMVAAPTKSRIVVLYSLVEQVESKLEEIPSIMFMVRFYEFLLLLYLILRNSIVNPEYNSTAILNPGFTNMDFYLNYREVSQTILFVSGVITFAFFILISLTQIKSRGFEKGFILWICMFIIIFMRIVYVFVINQALNTFFKPQQYPNLGDYRFILVAPVLLFVIYSTLANRCNYIYGLLHPLIFAMHNFDSTNYGLFSIIGAVFLYRCFYDTENPYNSYIHTSVVGIVFYLLQEFKGDIQYVELCFLLFFIIMCLMHLFWRPMRITIFSEKKSSTRRVAQASKKQLLGAYFEYIKNKKEAAMKIEHELLVESIILDEYDQCPQNLIERLKPYVDGAKVVDWSVNEHLKFLISQTELYHADVKSKQSQIMLFQFKLEDPRLHFNSLLEVSEHFYKESIFKVQKYYLYRLMIKLQTWFKKFKNESAYVYNAIDTDDMVLKFYQALQTLLKRFLDIWGAIKKSVIDFSIIEPLYIEAITQYGLLEKLLIAIRKRVKSNNQIHRFNELSDLLQLKVLSKQDTKLSSFMDDQRDQQIPFLRISNRKIIYSSYKFNNRFHYTNDQIIGVDVNELLPESFRESFISNDQEVEEGVHLKLKQFYSIVLNGKGCLEYVKISPYIELDFLGQVTYMVFFSLETSPTSSFILYSIETDIIEELSNGFLELFGLECKDVHNTVTGKQAFQEFDFSSKKNREQLAVEGDTVETNISVFQFKSTIADRFNKISVTLKVVHVFDFHGSIRLLLEVKYLTSEHMKTMITGIGGVTGGHHNNPNTMYSTPKIDSKESFLSDQTSENKRFMMDLIEKKQTFNRNKNQTNFVSNHWKSILRCCLFVLAVVIVAIIFYYGARWYQYMQTQILELNQKIANLIAMFQNQFMLGILKKWPPSQLPEAQRQTMIQDYYGKLATSVNNLYFSIVKSLNELTLPLMSRFSGGVNPGIRFGGQDNLLDIVSNSYLIYTEDFVEFMLDKYPIVADLLNQAPNIEDNFFIFRVWMDLCLVVCVATLVVLILLRGYQIYEQKILQKILEDIQMLFSYLKDEEVTICTESIQKTLEEFQIVEESKPGKKIKQRSKIQKQLKLLKAKEEQKQPFIQRKTSKTSGSSVKTYVKSIVYVVVMVVFFSFLISYIVSVKKQMPNIIKYQNEIQLAVRRTQVNIVNSYQYMISQKLGRSVPLRLNNLFSTTLIKNDYLIPEQFSSFYGEIWDILNEDICLIAKVADLTRCKASILSKGLVNTLDLNLNNIKRMSLRGVDLMFSDGLYQELMFLRTYLMSEMQSILNMYFAEMNDYLSYRQNLFVVIIVFAVGISLFTMFLIWVDYWDEMNRNSICKSLFNIFPESFFLKPEIKQYLQETNLIQRILKF